MKSNNSGPTLKDVKENSFIKAWTKAADATLAVIGYTDHGNRHLGIVSDRSRAILTKLGYGERRAELGAIAGYIHDIGNALARRQHGALGAVMASQVLAGMGMDPQEIADIMIAISLHEDEVGAPVNDLCAALVLADKSDVHVTRVRDINNINVDIHDRVNAAARKSSLAIRAPQKEIELRLDIDNQISSVLEYFEIFISRMVMCRKAADFLGCRFILNINGNVLTRSGITESSEEKTGEPRG
jgi:metal-dependent HD superfamily phosphatase/phosphodiesterase